jgi:DNA-binding Lrp family transcriptional regulator
MSLKIKKLDWEILRNLLKDGRIGYEEIAKEHGVSKNKVWKHLKSMENKGIVVGATTQVNFNHLGFEALATLLISVEAQQIECVMDLIQKITEVRAYRQYNSVYNVRAFAPLRNLSELDHIKQVLRRSLPTMGLKTYIWVGVRNTPENMTPKGNLKTRSTSPSSKNMQSASSNNALTIDELDRAIIEKLSIDGRAPYCKIAKEVGLSTDTVIKRYHRLKKNGTVKISIQINPSKIGYVALLDFNIAFVSPSGLLDSVIESLANIPDIITMTKTSGDYDLQLSVMVRSVEQSFALQDEISKICGTTKIEVSARKIPERWPTPQQYISTF